MAKAITYLTKIEGYRTTAATGFRIKQAMYNALLACHKEEIKFLYHQLLWQYCIPGQDDYLADEGYYMLTDEGFVVSERTVSEREAAFKVIAERMGGELAFTPEREPVILVDGWVLRGGKMSESVQYTTEPTEDFSLPYPLYPRVIDINGDWQLIEESAHTMVWKPINKENKEGKM